MIHTLHPASDRYPFDFQAFFTNNSLCIIEKL